MTIEEMFSGLGVKIDTIEFKEYVSKYAIQNVPPGGLITAWVGEDDGTEEVMATCQQNRKGNRTRP